jgi:hypothetical protein
MCEERKQREENTGKSFVNASIVCNNNIQDISYFDESRYIRLHCF